MSKEMGDSGWKEYGVYWQSVGKLTHLEIQFHIWKCNGKQDTRMEKTDPITEGLE